MGIFETWFPLPVREKGQVLANLKRNWYFPISAMAFFCVSARLTLGYLLGLLTALLAAVMVASQVPSLWAYSKGKPMGLKVVSFLTAAGVCWAGQASFYAAWSLSPKTQALAALLPVPVDIPCFVSVFGAIAALFFVFFYVLVFLEKMTDLLSRNHVFGGTTSMERIIYGVLLAISVVLTVAVFVRTDAFYGTAHEYDVIYTSDSPSLVQKCAYLTLTHLQNDLRQPLFALFAAPFVGLPYFVGKLLGGPVLQAVLMNSVQILLLFAANFMLAKMLKLTPGKRICFLVLNFVTYANLLFTLMMEQYIVAYFWMIFCMYLISEQKPSRMALWGAGGTLLTSMVLLPFMSRKHPVRDFKGWFADMAGLGLSFVALMLVFCRFDVIYDLTGKIASLSSFGGAELTILDKLCQYTAFVVSCFAAPAAGVNTTAFAHISWQLQPVTGLNWIGIAIAVLALIGALVSRKEKISQFAAVWIALSVVMLVGLGWGTSENGLILYGLYFGWAFLVLLFQLAEAIERKRNVKFLVTVTSLGCAILLAMVNIPAMIELVQFAIAHYPA